MKFAKDSLEWGIFGAVWKFYQEFYEPKSYDDTGVSEWVSESGEAMTRILKPLEGKPQYNLAKNLFMACFADIADRIDRTWKENKHE